MYIYIYIWFWCLIKQKISKDIHVFWKGMFTLYTCIATEQTFTQFFFDENSVTILLKYAESWKPYCSSRDKEADDAKTSVAPDQDRSRSLSPTQVVDSDVESKSTTPLVDAKKLAPKTPYVPKGWTLRQAQNHTTAIYVFSLYVFYLGVYVWVSWCINKCLYTYLRCYISYMFVILATFDPEPPGTPVCQPCSSTWDELPKLASIECAHLRQRERNCPHQHMCWRNGKPVTRMPWRNCWKMPTLTRTVITILYNCLHFECTLISYILALDPLFVWSLHGPTKCQDEFFSQLLIVIKRKKDIPAGHWRGLVLWIGAWRAWLVEVVFLDFWWIMNIQNQNVSIFSLVS